MLYRLYVHQEHVIIPVVAQTEEGFYVDTPPVVRIHVSDTANWKAVLLEALEAGNQIIPTPEASDSGSSCLLETLKLEKWTTFEKRACMYTVHSGVSCIKMYRTGKAPDGMWGPNNQIEHTFPSATISSNNPKPTQSKAAD
jgi:hypothetical protein